MADPFQPWSSFQETHGLPPACSLRIDLLNQCSDAQWPWKKRKLDRPFVGLADFKFGTLPPPKKRKKERRNTGWNPALPPKKRSRKRGGGGRHQATGDGSVGRPKKLKKRRRNPLLPPKQMLSKKESTHRADGSVGWLLEGLAGPALQLQHPQQHPIRAGRLQVRVPHRCRRTPANAGEIPRETPS